MLKTILLVWFVIFCQFVFSQNYQIKWQNCFGGSESEHVYDIIEINNEYYILGVTSSNDGDILYNHGQGDVWLVKTDSTGNIIWEKTYGGTAGETGHRIFANSQNELYLLNSSLSSDGDISNDPYLNSLDFWIIKIDIDGSIVWEKIVGGNGGDYPWTGIITNDGSIIALGWSGSEYGDVSINYGLYDIWMIKLNSEGEVEWDFTLGTDWQDYGQALIQTSDGGFLVGGSSKLTGGGNLNCECQGQADGVLVKLDADRNIQWQRCYGGSDYDLVWSVLELSDGYIFVGGAGSNDGDISGYHGDGDIWTVKIDFFGDIIWQKCLGGSRSEYANILYQTSNHEYFISGGTRSNDEDVTGNHSLSEFDYDIWVVKLNNEGELLSQQCFGGSGSEKVEFGVVKKSDNNFVIAGQTDFGPSYDVACTPHGTNGIDDDWWLFEIDLEDTTNVVEANIGPQPIKVYPNPAGDYVIFEISAAPPTPLKGGEPVRVVIMDMFGREVAGKEITTKKAVFDLRNLQQGVYFYQTEIDGIVYTGKFIVQK